MLEIQTDFNGTITKANEQAIKYGFHIGDPVQPLLHGAVDKHTWMHLIVDAHDGQTHNIKASRGLFTFCFEAVADMNYINMNGLLIDSAQSGIQPAIEKKFLRDMEQIDDVQNAIIATNTQGVVIYANAGVQTIYGWKPQDLVGRLVGDCIVLESQKVVSDLILQQLKEGKVWSGPYTAKHLDGRELPVLVVDYPLFNDSNHLIGIVGVSCLMNDSLPNQRTIQYVASPARELSSFITDAEAATLDIIADTTTSGSDKVQSMIKKAVEATQVMAVNMDLITSISHELRTPIHGILSECEHMREQVESASTLNADLVNELQDSVQIIMSSTVLQLQLVNNILSIPGQTLDQKSMKQASMEAFTEVTILKFMNDLLLSVAWNLKQKNIAAHINLKSKLPTVIKFNKSYVGQVMLNLLSNAIKYSPRDSKVILALEVVDGVFTCTVQDSGAGINDDRIPYIFKKRTRADPSAPSAQPTLTARTSLDQSPLYNQSIPSSEGIGLGLSISKSLIEAMDGKIWYEKSGKFCFQIPVVIPLNVNFHEDQLINAEELHNMVAGPQQVQHKARSTETPQAADAITADLSRFSPVCIAEDNPINQRVLIKMLQKSNIPRKDVAVANDGVECIELCSASKFQFVLIDFSMPRMDGIEATKRLRQRGYSGKIVGITANALQQHVDMGIEAGMDFVLIKPVSQVQLVKAMQDLEVKV